MLLALPLLVAVASVKKPDSLLEEDTWPVALLWSRPPNWLSPVAVPPTDGKVVGTLGSSWADGKVVVGSPARIPELELAVAELAGVAP